MGIFFLGLFYDSFFSQKTETLPRRVSVFFYMFMILFFFLVFQLTLQVQSLNHYVPNIDVYHTYSIYIVACLVCYYRALPIFFLIHLKRWLNNENLILPNKICKNFLIFHMHARLRIDQETLRIILQYYYIYGPWVLPAII